MPASPFALDHPEAYLRWRAEKLAGYPDRIERLLVDLADPHALSAAEREAIHARCRRANMALYASDTGLVEDKEVPRALGAQFGLTRLDANLNADDDGITPLAVSAERARGEYIPYSNRPIDWHTDGYYNAPGRQIRAFVLHCVRRAAEGGENALLDPEIAYIHLRDRSPEYIRALMAPDAMTIPPNIVDGEELRPARTGPVFSILAGGQLHMRYTRRKRSVIWAPDPVLREAVATLERLLDGEAPHILRATLAPGQGLICNNVLHTRSGFRDGTSPQDRRLLYRARYYERIQDRPQGR